MNHWLIGFFVTASALAFPKAEFWHQAAAGDVPEPTVYDPQGIPGNNRAGAGGIYGTGGARDFGIKCSHCHVQTGKEPYGLVDGQIDASPAWQVVAGDDAYTPGQRYTITVTLLNEHRFSDPTEFNQDVNGMSVAIEDANGDTAGVYVTDTGTRSDACPAVQPSSSALDGHTTVVFGDCHAVLPVQYNAPRLTVWTFDWIAPAAGTGDLTLYWAVVDGDSVALSSLHDDAKEGTIALKEAP